MSEEEIYFPDGKYLSLKRASEITGYAKDYIGQLCRGNKIKARRLGRDWFVENESLMSYKTKPKIHKKEKMSEKEETPAVPQVEAPKISEEKTEIKTEQVSALEEKKEDKKQQLEQRAENQESQEKEKLEVKEKTDEIPPSFKYFLNKQSEQKEEENIEEKIPVFNQRAPVLDEWDKEILGLSERKEEKIEIPVRVSVMKSKADFVNQVFPITYISENNGDKKDKKIEPKISPEEIKNIEENIPVPYSRSLIPLASAMVAFVLVFGYFIYSNQIPRVYGEMKSNYAGLFDTTAAVIDGISVIPTLFKSGTTYYEINTNLTSDSNAIFSRQILTKEISTRTVKTKNLEMEDEITHEIYCAKMLNNEIKTFGKRCEDVTAEDIKNIMSSSTEATSSPEQI
ncbi:MAG: hypothetical protein AB1643_00935 [Patescibacteria group bacterium]